MKDIYLDTETTGLSAKKGDKLVSVAAIKDNEVFYVEIDPMRQIPKAASKIHGIDAKYLKDRHARPFGHYADSLLKFLDGNRLIIHNARFDMSFLNNEFRKHLGDQSFDLGTNCEVVDTLKIARGLYKGQKNSLSALAQRLGVEDNREKHNAYEDALILKNVAKVLFSEQAKQQEVQKQAAEVLPRKRRRIA